MTARYPARNPAQNIADLKAQIAANAKGVAELRKMIAHYGLDVVNAYMGHVQDNAAERVRQRDRRAAGCGGFDMRWMMARRSVWRSRSIAKARARASISPARARSATTISMRPSR